MSSRICIRSRASQSSLASPHHLVSRPRLNEVVHSSEQPTAPLQAHRSPPLRPRPTLVAQSPPRPDEPISLRRGRSQRPQRAASLLLALDTHSARDLAPRRVSITT
jgi:hypothetical protein